jgi:hypothetical protein
MVLKPSRTSACGPRHLGLHPNGNLGCRRVDGRMGSGNAHQLPRCGNKTAGRALCPSPRPLYPGRRGAKIHQSERTPGHHSRPPKLPAGCPRCLRASFLQLSSHVSRYKELTSRSLRMMLLLRFLRKLCDDNGISLRLQSIPSVLNIWADRL